jgi:hypothetical protein
MKFIIRYSFWIVSTFFILNIFCVLLLKVHIDNDLIIKVIDYLFWYSFGFFSGFSIVRKILSMHNNE